MVRDSNTASTMVIRFLILVLLIAVGSSVIADIIVHRRASHRTVAAAPSDGPNEFDDSLYGADAEYHCVIEDVTAFSFTAEQNTRYGTNKHESWEFAETIIHTGTLTANRCLNMIDPFVDVASATVTLNGAETDPDNRIIVRTIGEARHSGAWDDTKYVLSVASYALTIDDQYVEINGPQIDETSASSRNCVALQEPHITIANCILRTTDNANSDISIFCNETGDDGIVVYNTICINRGTGSTSTCVDANNSGTGYAISFYNCTFIMDGDTALLLRASPTYVPTFQNCLIYGADTVASGDVSNATSNCSTDLGSYGWTGGGSDLNVSQVISFVDPANLNFLLAAYDTGAIDLGTNLAGIFTRDIKYETRSGTWCIGADEVEFAAIDGPDDVNGLLAWYKPETLTNTVDGSEVVHWPDSSGNDYHLISPTGPAYYSSILNGVDILRYGAATDYLRTNLTSLVQPRTHFSVAIATNTAAGYLYDSDGGSGRNMLWLASGAATLYSGTGLTGPVINNTEYYLWALTIDGTSSAIRTNKVNAASGDSGAGPWDGITVGNRNTAATAWRGDIAETIFYSGALNSDEVSAIEEYLWSKYDLGNN